MKSSVAWVVTVQARAEVAHPDMAMAVLIHGYGRITGQAVLIKRIVTVEGELLCPGIGLIHLAVVMHDPKRTVAILKNPVHRVGGKTERVARFFAVLAMVARNRIETAPGRRRKSR